MDSTPKARSCAPLVADDAAQIEAEIVSKEAVEVRALAWAMLTDEAEDIAPDAGRASLSAVAEAFADHAERLRHVARLLDLAAARARSAAHGASAATAHVSVPAPGTRLA